MYLNCHSFHSLRYGTFSVQNLVQSAVESGAETLCLTDINTMTAVYEFLKTCKAVGIKPVVGMEFRNEGELLYIALAKNETALSEINQLLTDHNCEGIPLPKHHPKFHKSFTIYPIENIPENLLDHEYIGIRPDQVNMLFQKQWRDLIYKMVIFQPVTVKNEVEYELHKVLRAIDMNTLITLLKPHQHCRADETMLSQEKLLNYYKQYPEIISNTQNILEECSFDYDFSYPRNKKHYTRDKQNDIKLLTSLA